MPTGFHIHLVSDATGETLNSITRACLVQFEDVTAIEHSWTLIRTTGQMQKVLQGIQQNPGLVLYTIVDDKLRNLLVSSCRDIGATLVPVLDPVMTALAGHFGQTAKGLSGRQHIMDQGYFHRIEAMDYALSHDDGQSARNYEAADVILVGVSRSSKTPTCIYLANRGVPLGETTPLLPARTTKQVNALLATCGLYDEAGDFAYRVGMPGKSGVGGGIMALIPGELVVCVWSPELNKAGNSLAGTAALELLAERLGRSIF